jgi:hypothetical protein
MTVMLDDLAEEPGEWVQPDRQGTLIDSVFAADGVYILAGGGPVYESVFWGDQLVDYEQAWLGDNGGVHAVMGDLSTYISPGGWDYATPYMDVPELLALGCNDDLAGWLSTLTGEPMGLHLCLTGWQSTRRNWHFDQYLNPPGVGGFYVAVWIALDDIHPDAGPFEYVPGSHRWWPPIDQAKMRAALGTDGDGPDWPTRSERILTPLFEAELDARGITPTPFLGRRGDVLFWHSRLLHRGSIPKDPTLERRGLIMHFSGIHHRPDMPPAVQHPNGGWFFPLGGRQPMIYPEAS